MPLKLQVGVSRKVGLPHYSSLGASCHVELELDPLLLAADLERFHQQVRSTYIACHQAVSDELARQQELGSPANGQTASDHGNGRHVADASLCDEAAQLAADSAPEEDNGEATELSARQYSYLRQLAVQTHLGLKGLETLCQQLYDQPLNALSRIEASALIESLKQVRAGERRLEDVWSEAG